MARRTLTEEEFDDQWDSEYAEDWPELDDAFDLIDDWDDDTDFYEEA